MSKRKRSQFTLRAEWKEGAPNPAWDELWRRIFAGPLRGFSLDATSREQR